jgi:hypothetical protein
MLSFFLMKPNFRCHCEVSGVTCVPMVGGLHTFGDIYDEKTFLPSHVLPWQCCVR